MHQRRNVQAPRVPGIALAAPIQRLYRMQKLSPHMVTEADSRTAHRVLETPVVDTVLPRNLCHRRLQLQGHQCITTTQGPDDCQLSCSQGESRLAFWRLPSKQRVANLLMRQRDGHVRGVHAVVLRGGVLCQESDRGPELQRQQQHSCVLQRLAPAAAVVQRRELDQVGLQVAQGVGPCFSAAGCRTQ